MHQKSLGIIEIRGLASAIEAADTALKSANVTLVGYELARGGGWATVKVLGDVGAVKAAVDAVRASAAACGHMVSARVIARPAEAIAPLVENADTVGWGAPQRASEAAREKAAASARPARSAAPGAKAAARAAAFATDESKESGFEGATKAPERKPAARRGAAAPKAPKAPTRTAKAKAAAPKPEAAETKAKPEVEVSEAAAPKGASAKAGSAEQGAQAAPGTVGVLRRSKSKSPKHK